MPQKFYGEMTYLLILGNA